MNNWIEDILDSKIEILNSLKKSDYFDTVESVGELLVDALKKNKKILIAGNGGSAADAQHFAGEVVGRFLKNRKALPAISLCTDPTIVTSISNDYGFDDLFSREIEGLGNEGDVFIAISTSGNSNNCIKAIKEAHKKRIYVVGLLGKNGGKMKDICDLSLVVPSDSTPRIQEIHTFTIHLLCQIIDEKISGENNELEKICN